MIRSRAIWMTRTTMVPHGGSARVAKAALGAVRFWRNTNLAASPALAAPDARANPWKSPCGQSLTMLRTGATLVEDQVSGDS
jgi:hypothetical protein